MSKKAIQILLTFCPFLLSAQSDCLRSESTFPGEIVVHEYNTAYYFDTEVFDFPVFKIWIIKTGDRIWSIPGGVTNEKVIMQSDRTLAPPDTFRFERFIKTTGKNTKWQLTRFFGDIYQVWQIVETRYAVVLLEVRIYRGIYQGWPDDYMNALAYKTDRVKVLAKIEKYRCKDRDAGRKKAGVN